MKKLYIAASNHMDPSWRRAFLQHFSLEDGVVRPYSDIEECELAAYFDFAERYGMKFSVEQALSVRTFLARNPDLADRFAALVRAGQIELMGGGECVIDVNLVSGESIVRTQLCGIRYYDRTFGVRPRHANLPDVFGVSAQMPQILRGFGYTAVHNISRVRDDRPPFWRGLDGTLIYADEPGTDFPCPINCIADFGKYSPCPACHGEGCDLCGGSGFDLSYTFFANEHADRAHEIPTTEEFLSQNEDAPELLLTLFSEETTHDRGYLDHLLRAAADHGREVVFLTYHEVLLHAPACRDRFERLAQGGEIRPEEIDGPAEYNPMAAGCYTSRIEIKKQNRELEALLMGTEAACALCGGPFPEATLEYLWRKMAFIQFHDCVTGTITDTSYDELIRLCREVRFGAMRLRDDALARLAGQVSADGALGTPFLLFNPGGAPLSGLPLRAVIRNTEAEAVEIFDARGARCPVTEICRTEGKEYGSLAVSFLSDLPALGYSVFYWRPAAPHPAASLPLPEIRNAHYRVTDAAIFAADGTPLMLGCPGALRLSSDHGHAWGRTKREDAVRTLVPESVTAEAGEGCARLIFRGSYAAPTEQIMRLDWTTTVTLYDDIPRVFFENEIDWEGKGWRLSADFPLAGKVGERALYGIPFGAIERDDRRAEEYDEELGYFDEWPAYGYFAAHDAAADRSFLVYTGGLCGARQADVSMQVILLRAPDETFYCVDNDGVHEPGRHVACYAFEAAPGRPETARPAHFAAAFDQVRAYCAPVAPGGRALPPRGRLLDADLTEPVLSAVRRAADGDLVLRFWEPYGAPAAVTLPEPASLTDFLEERDEPLPAGPLPLRPFEIKTVRLKNAGQN